MSLATAARLARRELRAGLRGFYIFLACLALGVAAIAGVGTVRSAIQAGLDREGAALLGGDAEIELTYRYANEDELTWMTETALRVSEVVDFRSMAVVGDERALTQVKAVDDLYPLIGTMQLDPAVPLEQALDGNGALPGGVMAKALADRLGLVAGDSFRLGSQDFTLSAIITREPDDAGAGFSLGPRTLVRSVDLANSGLLGPGTLFETKYRLDLPDTADLEVTEQEARDVFSASGIRWRDSRNGAPGVERFVNRLGSFLVIVGLSGLAVGGVGVSAAVQAYLQRKTGVIATLKTLGATRSTIFQSYFLQVMAIAVIGIAIGLIIGAGLPLALAPLITASLPIPAEFAIYPIPLMEAAIYGILTALLFTLIPLARTEAIRPATLFRDALGGKGAWPRPAYLIATALLVALLVGTAVSFSDAPTLTLWTALGIATALLVLFGAAKGIIALSRRLSRHANGLPALRWALAAIGGPRQEATSVVLSLGLGLSVLAAVGQIDGNLRYAIARDLPERAPSYFFVDIQTDQLEGFLQRVETDPSVTKVDTAPMLRGVV
ncbi:MAG: FtsX-like permease family protein, partial [Pseudomonadota bacterium]|nr:FtsX-like permease family protein [Pseudomonadota bacterium]